MCARRPCASSRASPGDLRNGFRFVVFGLWLGSHSRGRWGLATLTRFDEIEASQKARGLTRAVYQSSRKGDFSKDFALRDQARRASTSVMSNIAEGFERGRTKELLQFLAVAKGSAGELQS